MSRFNIKQGNSDCCGICYGNKNVKNICNKEGEEIVKPLCEDCRKEFAVELMKDLYNDLPVCS